MMQLLPVVCLSLAQKMEEHEVPIILELQLSSISSQFKSKSDQALLDLMRVTPGLSVFAEDSEAAGRSVELLEFARKRFLKGVGQMEVRSKAVATLRMFDLGVQERILESCRKVLRGSMFVFHNDCASVISEPVTETQKNLNVEKAAGED